MKNEYKKPVVKMIDYAYQEQVVASSSATGTEVDGVGNTRCTYFWPGCDLIYSTGYNCTTSIPDSPTL